MSAFYAVGAYLWAFFGSQQYYVLHFAPGTQPANLPFLLPGDAFYLFLFIAIIVAALTGILLGTPVLRLRGDYLAIVTLGFGEVIRVSLTTWISRSTQDAGTAAKAATAPGRAPIATRPPAAIAASLALAILPTNIFCPRNATAAATRTPTQAARIPVVTAQSAAGSARSGGGPGDRAPSTDPTASRPRARRRRR